MDRKNSKILFLDLDDTLLNHNKEITEGNRTAIQEAVKAGHRIVLASGRPLLAVLPIAAELKLQGEGTYVLAYNGAEIYDCFRKEVLYRNPVTTATAAELFQEAHRYGIHVQTYNHDDIFLAEAEDEATLYYAKRIRIPYQIVEDLEHHLPENPVKVLLIDLHDHEKLEQFRLDHQESLASRCSMFYSNPMFLECVAPDCSKGAAIHQVAELFDLPMENTIAAGDSENDLSMIREAGIGCAMANGTKTCKEAADYVTKADCDHDGIAEIIHNFLLN